MNYNHIIRKNAAGLINKNITVCVGIMLFYFAIDIIRSLLSEISGFLFNNTTAVSNTIQQSLYWLITIFIFSPLVIGIYRWFWRLTLDVKDNISEIFYYFSSRQFYKKALLLSLIETLLLLPAYFLAYFTNEFNLITISSRQGDGPTHMQSNAIMFQMWNVMLFLTLSIISIWLMYRFFLSKFLIFNDEALTAKGAFKLSFKMMKGNVTKAIGFSLGYIGWILLSVLIIPKVYTTPLLFTGQAIFAQSLMIKYNYRLKTEGAYYAGV